MLEKIVQIKSIGRFRDYSVNGDVTFRKLPLVYAENGRGKTTLCAILRSLQTGQKEFITERKTLAATVPAFVHLRLNNASYQFTNDAWTVTHPEILIFDPVFVNDNVYSGDYVEHEHRKNLYRAIVGAQGVQLARQIEGLDGQIRDANADLRNKKDAIAKHAPSGVALDDYLQWQPLVDVEAQIRQKTEELNNRQRAAAKSGEIQAKGLFVKVQIPSLPSDFATVLAKQLTDIVADAETKVRQQIARHQMGHQGEPWLSQGLGYVRDNRCPFCGQGVQANELIAAYRSHFSAAYANLKQEVARLGQRVNGAIGETSLGSAQQAIAGNAALAEFWRQFTTFDLPVISFQDIQQKYTALREKCLALAKRKQDSPTDAVTPDAEFAAALGSVVFAHTTTEGWEALLSGMIRGGWTITGSWPIATEIGSRLRARDSAALATSVHLVCRPRPEDAPVGDRGEVLRELPKRVGDWMDRFQGEGIRGADLVFACIGPALEIFSRYRKVETADGKEVKLADYLTKVWEVVGRTALEQILGTAEARARNGAAGALEEDSRLTALFLWTLQSTNGGTGTENGAESDDDESGDEDEDESAPKGKSKGFSLVLDVARRFTQPLGVDLPKWEGRIIETKKGVVRLLAVSERARQFFGDDGADAAAGLLERDPKKDLQQMLFPELEAERVPKVRGRRGRIVADGRNLEMKTEHAATTLDRVHAAMLLQAGGQANGLRALIKSEQERGPDFLRLANALSALYPAGSEENRLLDATLLAAPR